MYQVVNSQKMRSIDAYMMEKNQIPGVILMENAAMGVSGHIEQEYAKGARVHVFCGTGNNGGDGFAVARQLLVKGYDVKVAVAGDLEKIAGDAKINFDGLKATCDQMFHIAKEQQIDEILGQMGPCDVQVDALFGTGLSREITGMYRALIGKINSVKAPVVAVDIPSGISSDSGQKLGVAIRAQATVTFQYPKLGHFIYPGREYAGKLIVHKIGIDRGCPQAEKVDIAVYQKDTKALTLPKRPGNSNKGTFGTLGIIAGSHGMAGACVLAVRAALRSGAGLVCVGSSSYVVDILQHQIPQAVTRKLFEDREQVKIRPDTVDDFLAGKTAVVIGPGLGISQRAGELLEYIIASFGGKLVIDADGLNLLSRNLQMLRSRRGEIIVTPHPKEMARLMGVEVEHVVSEPVTYAVELAREYGITVLLKGSTTVVATPNGKARLLLNGNSGMAKGGSGDVLSGVIGSLCAQGISCSQSGVLGAFLCGYASDMALRQSSEYALTPLDTIRHLKDGFTFLQNNQEGNAPAFLSQLMQEEITASSLETLEEEQARPDPWDEKMGANFLQRDQKAEPLQGEWEEEPLEEMPYKSQQERYEQPHWEEEVPYESQQEGEQPHWEEGISSQGKPKKLVKRKGEPVRTIHQGRKIKTVLPEEFAKLIATEDQMEQLTGEEMGEQLADKMTDEQLPGEPLVEETLDDQLVGEAPEEEPLVEETLDEQMPEESAHEQPEGTRQ